MIAIISATWDEIKGIKKKLSGIEEGRWDELGFIIGALFGKPVIIGQTGVGIKRARKALSYFASYPSHILPFLRFRFFNSKKSSRSLSRFLRNVVLEFKG